MSTDVPGLRIKRLSQPPALSWSLWSASQPDLVVTVDMAPEEYRAALAGGPNAVGEAVRRRIDEGQERLRAFQAQLEDL